MEEEVAVVECSTEGEELGLYRRGEGQFGREISLQPHLELCPAALPDAAARPLRPLRSVPSPLLRCSAARRSSRASWGGRGDGSGGEQCPLPSFPLYCCPPPLTFAGEALG